MKIYSPSATTTFMTCPTLWWMKYKQGYMSKRIGNPECAAAVGIGVSTGMETFYKGGSVERAIEAGRLSASASLTERLDAGAVVVPRSEATFTAVPTRVEKAIRGFHKVQPFPSDWHTFIPELTFPDHGRARADLLCQSDLGPCIVDFKTKVTVSKAYIIDDFLFDAETSWQMYHYIWAARQMGLDVQSFAICLVVIEPLKIYLEQWVVDDEQLGRWIASAEYWWDAMEHLEAASALGVSMPRAADHRTKYGLCDLYDGCMHSAWDVAYIKKERP